MTLYRAVKLYVPRSVVGESLRDVMKTIGFDGVFCAIVDLPEKAEVIVVESYRDKKLTSPDHKDKIFLLLSMDGEVSDLPPNVKMIPLPNFGGHIAKRIFNISWAHGKLPSL